MYVLTFTPAQVRELRALSVDPWSDDAHDATDHASPHGRWLAVLAPAIERASSGRPRGTATARVELPYTDPAMMAAAARDIDNAADILADHVEPGDRRIGHALAAMADALATTARDIAALRGHPSGAPVRDLAPAPAESPLAPVESPHHTCAHTDCDARAIGLMVGIVGTPGTSILVCREHAGSYGTGWRFDAFPGAISREPAESPREPATGRQWIAGWNLPGCLPDTDDALPTFATRADAVAYIREELERAGNDCDDDRASDVFARTAATFGDDCGMSPLMPDGYLYWIDIADIEPDSEPDTFDDAAANASMPTHAQGSTLHVLYAVDTDGFKIRCSEPMPWHSALALFDARTEERYAGERPEIRYYAVREAFDAQWSTARVDLTHGRARGREICPGDRIEMHPATDRWMRGDRYGNVERIRQGRTMLATVRFDRSGQIRTVPFSAIGRVISDASRN